MCNILNKIVWDCIGINPVGYAHVRRSVYPRDVVSHENEATVGLYVLLLVALGLPYASFSRFYHCETQPYISHFVT